MRETSNRHLAFDHVDEAAVCQDSIGSKDVEEVREVWNGDPQVGARLGFKLIAHHLAAPKRR